MSLEFALRSNRFERLSDVADVPGKTGIERRLLIAGNMGDESGVGDKPRGHGAREPRENATDAGPANPSNSRRVPAVRPVPVETVHTIALAESPRVFQTSPTFAAEEVLIRLALASADLSVSYCRYLA
jgi:hypothetical protein